MRSPEQKPPGAGRSTPPPADPIAALFEHARGDGFTASETEQLWTNLGAVLGLPMSGGGASAPAGSASTAGGVLTTKTLAVLLLGGGAVVAAGGFVAVGGVGRTLHHAAPATANSTSAGVPTRDVGSLSTVATSAGDMVIVRNAQPAAVPPAATAPSPIERTPQAKPPKYESPSHPSSQGFHASETGTSQSPPSRGIDRAEHVEERDSPALPVNRPPADPPPNEGALLLRAQQVLASDPSAALDLTRQHARLFPAGGLVPEREVLAIEALVQLGRLEEARARFGAFRARFPGSPHLARLDGLLRR
jgi:hypothetical protein